ncbi:hydroxymethylglutaryl-CoA reductase, degradative [Candidatus Babeliales bacterium]|nr:hydroxymethylglutaryl-CoA reductase, degradative [Candidatus Babeliales bacterium]
MHFFQTENILFQKMAFFNKKTSKISFFYKKTYQEKLEELKNFANLTEQDIFELKNLAQLSFGTADKMVENVISTIQIPLGIATNFLINKKNYLVPMATEEPSVIAAASNGAKLARFSGGFTATSTQPIMIGQIQIINIKNIKEIKSKILQNKNFLLKLANKQDIFLQKLGGGAINLKLKTLKTNRCNMLIVNLFVNVKDAMGANIINTMLEKIAPEIEKITNHKILLKIISNLSIYRMAKAKAVWKKEILGQDTIENILDAYEFAKIDIFRTVTHNKGIMNGIDAVALATGNDFRAIEAGAHGYACYKKKYAPLTHYYKNKNQDLVGKIYLPIPVGTIGGITNIHPSAKLSLKILGAKSACELSQIMASVGLAQNFAALKALVTDGIQKGHMTLHKRKL